MFGNTLRAVVATLALAAGASQASAIWLWSQVTSGVAGDAGTFGKSVDIDGDRAIVSDGALGAYVFEPNSAGTGWNRVNLSSPYTEVRGVAIAGDYAFLVTQNDLRIFEHHSFGWLTDATFTFGAWQYGYGGVAADGNFVAVSMYSPVWGWYVDLYQRGSGGWSCVQRLTAPGGESYFGYRVDVVDLLNVGFVGGPPDERARVIVSSPYSTATGTYTSGGSVYGRGAAYIYDLANGVWTRTMLAPPTTPGICGWNVALTSGLAYASGANATGAAVVWAFEKGSSGWAPLTPITIPGGGSTAGYGGSLAASGSQVLIGIPGVSYLYQRTSTSWSWVTTMAYGNSAALSGNRAVVGYDSSGTSGIVRIYSN